MWHTMGGLWLPVALVCVAVLRCGVSVAANEDVSAEVGSIAVEADPSASLAAVSALVAAVQLSEQDVRARGLVAAQRSGNEQQILRDIVEQHHVVARNLSRKNFAGDALGYVTPWNAHGYDVAKVFAAKYSHIAPVWLQLHVKEVPNSKSVRVEITGRQDIDAGWMAAVRAAGHGHTLIVPRVIFELNKDEYLRLLRSDKVQSAVRRRLVKECQTYGLDGFVVEATSAWPVIQRFAPHLRSTLNAFMSALATDLHAMQPRRQLILVIPPPTLATDGDDSAGLFDSRDFLAVHSSVDRFSLMTYDYSAHYLRGTAGPNAPLPWVRECVTTELGRTLLAQPAVRAQVLMGINFYGMDYPHGGSGEPVLGTQFVALAAQQPPPSLAWNAEWREHTLQYTKGGDAGHEHAVSFPTLRSLDERLALATELGVGIGVWELGQGLDYFQDLL